MKLHLPSCLRKALLACLAALAAHRRVSRTVSTGTALLGVFTMLWSTAPPSQAKEESSLTAPAGGELVLGTAPETEEVTLDVPSWLEEANEGEDQNLPAANSGEDIIALAATDGVIPLANSAQEASLAENEDVATIAATFTVNADNDGTGSLTDAVNNHNLTTDSWNVNLSDGNNYFPVASGNNRDITVNASLYLEQTLKINNGSSGKGVVFAGAITGASGAHLVYAWGTDNIGKTQWWTFQDCLDGFAGNILTEGRDSTASNLADFTLEIQGTSNTGSINLVSQHDKLVLNNATMQNSSISVTGDMEVQGTNTLKSSTTKVSGTLTFGADSQILLGDGVTLDLQGTANTLMVSDGANFGLAEDASAATVKMQVSQTGGSNGTWNSKTISVGSGVTMEVTINHVEGENGGVWDIIGSGHNLNISGDGKLMLKKGTGDGAVYLKIHGSAQAVIGTDFSAEGVYLWIGDNISLTLEKGGTIQGFVGRWGNSNNTLTLGGDLVVKENTYHELASGSTTGGVSSVRLTKMGNAIQDVVYLIYENNELSTSLTVDELNGLFSFGTHVTVTDGVGYGLKTTQAITVTGGGTVAEAFKLEQGNVTFTGEGDNTVTFAKGLTIGESATLTFSGSGAASVGEDVILSSGATLEIASGMNVLGKLQAKGGVLKVTAGRLSLQGGVEGTLSNLVLGSETTGVQLNVGSGNLVLGGTLTLNGENTLTFAQADAAAAAGISLLAAEVPEWQTLDLTGVTLSGDGTLKLVVDADLLESLHQRSGITLVKGWNAEFANKITVELTGDEGDKFQNFQMENGQLVWNDDGNLVWTGTSGSLTLGDQSGTEEDGWSAASTNLAEHDVYLEGKPSEGSTITVTVNDGGDGISMKSLTVGKAEDDSATQYTFSTSSDAQQTITVTDALILNVDQVQFGDKVSVTAGRLVLGANASSVTIAQGASLAVEGGVSPSASSATFTVGGFLSLKGTIAGGVTFQASGTTGEISFSDSVDINSGDGVTVSGANAKLTWSSSGGMQSAGALTLSGENAEMHLTGAGAVEFSGGLSLENGAKLYVSGDGTKNFGGSSNSPGIHLGEGSELVIQAGGGAYGDGNWLTNGQNYATGEGSIVLEGVEATNSTNKSGILWAFMDASESGDSPQIGALKLRSSEEGTGTELTMTGEMGDASHHALGKFKEIYVGAGSSLIDSSGALGKKVHTGNKLHLAGTGYENEGGALVLNCDLGTGRQMDWDIVADADATIAVKKPNTFNGTLGAQGNTLTINTAEGKTTNLHTDFTAGTKDGTSGSLSFTGAGTVSLNNGFSMADGGSLVLEAGSNVELAADLTNSSSKSSIGGEGTLKLTAANGSFNGTISSGLTYAAAESGTYTIGTYSGSALTVESGQLTITNAVETLTSLTMGSEAGKGGALILQKGDLVLSGTLTLYGTNTLTFLQTSATAAAEGISLLAVDAPEGWQTLDLTGATLEGDGTLTLQIDAELLKSLHQHSGDLTLVEGWEESFNNKIVVQLTGDEGNNFEGVQIDASGKLVWDNSDLVWTGTSGSLTLGDQSGREEDGWSAASTNLAEHDVYLEGTPSADSTTIEVTVNGGEDNSISMKSLTVGGAGDNSAIQYTFSADVDTPQAITIVDALTLNVGEMSLGSGVSVTAGSLVISAPTTLNLETGATLSIGGPITGVSSTNKLTVTGQGGTLALDGAGDLNSYLVVANSNKLKLIELKGGTSWTASHDFSGANTIKVGESSELRVNASVWYNTTVSAAIELQGGTISLQSSRTNAQTVMLTSVTFTDGSVIKNDETRANYKNWKLGDVGGTGRLTILSNTGYADWHTTTFASEGNWDDFKGSIEFAAPDFNLNGHTHVVFEDGVDTITGGTGYFIGSYLGNWTMGQNVKAKVKKAFNVQETLTFATGSTLELSGISDAEAVTLAGSGGTVILDNSRLTVKAKATNAGAMGGIEFKDATSSFTLTTGNLTVGDLKGEGTVTLSGTDAKLTLEYGGDDEDGGTYAGTISAAELAYAGTDKTKKFTLTKGFTGAKLTLSGGVLALQGSVGAEGANTWDISGETQLDLSAEGLGLSDGSIALTVDVREENTLGALKLSEAVFTALKDSTGGFEKKLTLNLTGTTSGHKYRLIDATGLGSSVSVTQETLQGFLDSILPSHDDGWRGSVIIDVDGYLTVTTGHALTWDTANQNGTWKTYADGDSAKPWDDGNAGGGDSAFYAGDSVTFNDSTGTEHSITIEGDVAPQDMEVQAGTWTFSSGGSASITSENGVLTVSGENADVTFSDSVSINFGGGVTVSGENAKVHLNGNVTAGSITVNSGSLSFGTAAVPGVDDAAGTPASSNTLTLSGELTIGNMGIEAAATPEATVTVYSSGFGRLTDSDKDGYMVNIGKNGKLVFSGNASVSAWSSLDNSDGSAFVHGEGELVFDNVGTWVVGGTGVLHNFLKANDDSSSPALGNLRISGNSTFCMANASKTASKLANVGNIWVNDGATFMVYNGADLGTTAEGGNTLHLSGQGSHVSRVNDVVTHAMEAAFYVETDSTLQTGWAIEAEADTSIGVAGVPSAGTYAVGSVYTLNGELRGNGHTITKRAGGVLQLGTDFHTDTTGGCLDIEGGPIKLNYTDADALANYAISFSADSTGVEGYYANTSQRVLDVTATATDGYVVKYLEGTADLTASIKGAVNSKLIINFDGTAFGGTALEEAKVYADITRGAGNGLSLTKQGTGTQTIVGSFASSTLTVTGGKLALDASASGKSIDVKDGITVTGGELDLNVGSSTATGVHGTITVNGGGTLKANRLVGGTNTGNTDFFGYGHTDAAMLVGTTGDGASSGTVEVGTVGQLGGHLLVNYLELNHANSSVKVHGDACLGYINQGGRTPNYVDAGTLTVMGNLVTGGTLTVRNGGTVHVGGWYRGSATNANQNGGNITVTTGGSMTVGGDIKVDAVSVSGKKADGTSSSLTVNGATQSYGSITVGAADAEGGQVILGSDEDVENSQITVSGAVNVTNGGTLTLKRDTQASQLTGNGSVTGEGTLKLTGNGGSFSGSVSSNLEYAGSGDDGFTYNGQFTGAYLTVTSGELKLSSGATFGESTTATVKQGSKLNLNGGSYVAAGGSDGGMTVALAGGELHLNQNSEIAISKNSIL